MPENSVISAAAPAPPGTKAATRAETKSSSGKMILAVVLATAGGVGGAWFVIGRGRSSEAAGPHIISAGAVVHLEGFTVNLADKEESHFLRVTMDLALDHLPEAVDKDKPASGLPMAHIRDSILSVLTLCKADPLLTPEGKSQLKRNLLDSLRHDVPEIGVRDIYFTEFLVQR